MMIITTKYWLVFKDFLKVRSRALSTIFWLQFPVFPPHLLKFWSCKCVSSCFPVNSLVLEVVYHPFLIFNRRSLTESLASACFFPGICVFPELCIDMLKNGVEFSDAG